MSAVAATASYEQLLPRPPGGMVRGAALALAAHALLVLALTTVMQWRASPPEAVTAELWSAVPQVAAPRPLEPAPAPPPQARVAPPPAQVEPPRPDPQIVIEREKAQRQQAEREKAERERQREEKLAQERKDREAEAKRREQAERDRKAAEEKRLAEQRQKAMDRLMGQVGNSNTTASGTAAQDSGPSRSYAGKLVATIKPNIVFTDTVSGNPAAEVEVRAGPSGTIIARRLVRSSGHKEWDEAVLRAIDRTGTLPRDTDGRVPSTIIVAFRPQE